ncbi:MAG: DUF3768 domain-containing protein [Candidatus Margulisiibacteriota bacterium]|jgi:hypothetical protein
MDKKTEKIRKLNDLFRQTFLFGKVFLTQGITALSPEIQSQIAKQIQSFNNFNKENDPYGEHDFGSFELEDLKVFWKIDYYDLSSNFGSEDPANPAVTQRVLTIMLAEEY